ncbi:MAG: PASTA domain-containing protein [Calditrichia bacterium]
MQWIFSTTTGLSRSFRILFSIVSTRLALLFDKTRQRFLPSNVVDGFIWLSAAVKSLFSCRNLFRAAIARLKLREVGIEVGKVDYDYSERYPYREVVIAQSVSAGEQIYKNQAINLTVSLGPPPSSLVMPNLAGKSLESAKRELEVLGLSAGKLVTRLRYPIWCRTQ